MTSLNPVDHAEGARVTEAAVARVDELSVGQMKMAKVGDRRVLVACTASGISAIDNACPHQGYGLVTGALDADLVTCQWHNWKFRVSDGRCVVGEEDVESHAVSIRDNEVWVTVTEPTVAEKRERLWPSLQKAIANDYRGQIARDAARLLDTGVSADELISAGVAWRIAHNEWGMGHEMANAADCLVLSDSYEGLDKTIPVAQALAGLAEQTRDRPRNEAPPADGSIDFHQAVESEDALGAVAAVRSLVQAGDRDQLRTLFVESVGRHHLSYGHGAIYVQKSFELLDRTGWAHADELLSELASTIVYMTREDTLPYMAKAIRSIREVDLGALANAPVFADRADAAERFSQVLLDASEAPIAEAVDAAVTELGVEGLLDAVVLAVSKRLLRYDTSCESDPEGTFGWLDISHGMTYARAARWAWRANPGVDAARLVLFTVFLAFDTGRLERRVGVSESVAAKAGSDLVSAILAGDEAAAVGAALDLTVDEARDALGQVALSDAAGSFIVAAHLVKGTVAAWEEAATIGSNLPLAAVARLAAAPRAERFVARSAAEAIAFIKTGQPPQR
ncbi:MAG: Rieske 2Fe-2S domain-containing protein [Acidimicrobiales bacterium]